MAEFKLGRIKFVWKGDWSSSTAYYQDDVVKYGGQAYICTVGHTSDTDFYTDLNVIPSRWNILSDGQEWKGDWATATYYKINDVVKYGGNLYIANTAHTSAGTAADGLEADSASWDTYAEGFDWKGVWVASTRYKVNDLVKYGGQTYVCNTGHTSAGTNADGLEANLSNWDNFNPGIEYKGDWATGTRYKVNDVVKYGANLYIATQYHNSNAIDFESDAVNWNAFVEGFEFANEWNGSTTYKSGDLVRYGGNTYVSKTNNTDVTPPSSGSDWGLFAEGFSFQEEWSHTTDYKVGEVVSNGGYTYVAIADSPSTAFTITATDAGTNVFSTSSTTGMTVGQSIKFSGTTFGNVNSDALYFIKTVDSATDFTISEVHAGAAFTPDTATGSMTGTVAAHTTEPNYWGKLNEGVSWQGEWADDRDYDIGDAVKFGSNAYICINRHRSEGDDGSSIGAEGGGAANSRPDLDTTGTYWNQLITGSETDILTTAGDLVYYGGSGVARLPIGTEGQVLRAGSQYPEWASIGRADYVYFVAPHGTDGPYPIHGATVDKPFKTIRYACMQVEDGPRNHNTQHILKHNRAFIQREIVEYVNYQIELNTVTTPDAGSIWYNLEYLDDRLYRDVGYAVDALIFDLGHGGNVKTRGWANTRFDGLFESENTEEDAYPKVDLTAATETAAYTYMWQLVEKVINNEDPATNYQVTNGDLSTAVIQQFKDTDNPAETGIYTNITSLLTVIINATADADVSRVPARYSPSNLIKVSTGQYREVSPIIVPENTCILGDELRSTNAGPAGQITHETDTGYSLATYKHLRPIISDIIAGNSVTATSGNTEAQDIAVPFADTVEQTDTAKLLDTLIHNIDFRVGNLDLAEYPDPTGYNTSYLTGYGNARHLLMENKKFLQEEITLWIRENYPAVKYSRTKCKQDIGYVIDAMVYDLTYGGKKQIRDAAMAYYDGVAGALAFDSSELQATLGAYTELKAQAASIAGNVLLTKLGTINQYRNTAGSAAAVTYVEEAAQMVIDVITDVANRPSVTVSSIASNVITTSAIHGLSIGDKFVPRTSGNGLVANTTFWVDTVPTSSTLTVSQTWGGSTHSLSDGVSLDIICDITNNPAATDSVSTTTALITAAQTLDAQQETLVTAMSNYLADTYPSLTYNTDKCKRDTRLILEGVMYDFMFNSNYQTIKNAYAYLRSTASDVYDKGQKEATRNAFKYVADTIAGDTATYLNSDATAASRTETLMDLVDTIIYSGSTEGQRCQTAQRNKDYAILQMERNRNFIIKEATAFIADTYYDTATATTSTDDTITISDTSWLKRGVGVKFAGTTLLSPPLTAGGEGIEADTTYYVHKIESSTKFTVATTRNADAPMSLDDDTGSMTVMLAYDSAACERDVDKVIDAFQYDLQFTGNYKTLYAARYYGNSVKGSREEDFYYLRNGTGVRNQTLANMDGDLLAPNAYGTSRVSGGAYCSLDPGWGPADYRTWIIERSPYVQGVTTLGNGGIGQKIDGALHDGGNDSIVSNDFTQVISDGIGAWVANNGRAELVSVFTYYSHIGYLSTEGGRIRGTNGNNSYGDFGSVAEGFDSRETPNTAIVDNKFQFRPTIADVNTDADEEVYNVEFENAGNENTKAEMLISGAGTGCQVEVDEFRNGGVHNIFLEDNVDDSADAPEADGNFGGSGYVSNANTAQGGTTTSITLAATDAEISSAYIGMKVYVDGGTGVGQYGIITAYNAGTKIASVQKESDGTAGWDHLLPGTSIASPDASSTYVVEPRVELSAPDFGTVVTPGMPSTQTWTDAIYGPLSGVFIVSEDSGGSGQNASFTVTKNGFKYEVSIAAGGSGYERLEELVINGSNIGGDDITNDLTITITSVSSAGEILEVDIDGYGQPGTYVAVASGTSAGAYSLDGNTWTASTLPTSANWSGLAHAMIDDGSTIARQSRWVAVASGGTTAAYSDNGQTWVSSTLPTSANWSSVTFGEGRFVAVADDSTTVAISLDGIIWDITGTLTGTGYNAVAYGQGHYVAVAAGTSNAAWSTDGQTWTAASLPASSNWTSVAFGQNHFIAVADDSDNGAMSIDKGLTWAANTIGSPDSTTPAGIQQVKYGEGIFMATAYNAALNGYNYVATSQDGVYWEWQGYGDGSIGSSSGGVAAAFGHSKTRQGTWAVIDGGSTAQCVNIHYGATAKARAYVAENKIFKINIVEPGSGYKTAPTITITDPSVIYEAPVIVRIGNGVVANPSFVSRGTGYVSASGEVVNGSNDGYADFFQSGSFIAVRRLTEVPIAGSNVVFGHLPDETFKLVNVFTLLGSNDGAYTCFLQVSPNMKLFNAPNHGVSVTTRIRYSQVRLTGHDFLDIGTGNFTETNYPGLPTQDPIPANETRERNGGRVFYTSTDQDGNFRVGGLFSVEQSTGVATLNADAFNIAGLQELTLGEVTLGGGSASIEEFSTDPFFTADSDSVVPTQRAIKAYISSQIGGGGASLNVNSVTAGFIYIAGTQITTTTGAAISINANMNFKGSVDGYPLAWSYFLN